MSAVADIVSVVIPAWRSESTIAGSLAALRRQTFAPFETIVVDSSPDSATEAAAKPFGEVCFVRSSERLTPHAARDVGVAQARGRLLVFTDPDIYADPEWLARLVATHRESGASVVGGGLVCHGDRWLDQGIHLCKFSRWLPGGTVRSIDSFPTASLLVTRELYERLGGFSGSPFLADTLFCWAATRAGHTLRLEPAALAAHHHVQRYRDFLRERFVRAMEYGEVRASWNRFGVGRDLLFLAVSVLGLRLVRLLPLMARDCRRAGLLGTFVATLPISVSGHAASLIGESVAYARRLGRRCRGVSPDRGTPPH